MNRSQQLADKIQQQIEQSQLPDGELFMTEAEIASTFAASRTVVREAVGRLRTIGLLEGRQKKGLIVRRPDPVKLFASSLTSYSNHDAAELAQLRYAIEVGAIELAVKNATDEQVQQLSHLADQIKLAAGSRSSRKTETKLDIQFHSLLLEMTGSKLIADMQRVLVDFFRTTPNDLGNAADYAQRTAWEHSELASAIRDRDIERARVMIRMQVSRYLSRSND